MAGKKAAEALRATQELRRSGAAGLHRNRASRRQGSRSAARRAAVREGS